jgi:hypothetical protein
MRQKRILFCPASSRHATLDRPSFQSAFTLYAPQPSGGGAVLSDWCQVAQPPALVREPSHPGSQADQFERSPTAISITGNFGLHGSLGFQHRLPQNSNFTTQVIDFVVHHETSCICNPVEQI